MVIRSPWRRRHQSELVRDTAGHEYEIATFEGGKGPLDRFAPRDPLKAVPFGTKLRASVFLKGGRVQFTVDTDAPLSSMDRAFAAIRGEARRRLESGQWEEGASYYLPVEPEP